MFEKYTMRRHWRAIVRTLAVIGASTAAVMSTPGQSRSDNIPGPTVPASAQQLIGAWRLVSYIETNVDTGETSYPLGKDATGFILYTPDGYMSAQMQSAGRKGFTEGDMFRGELAEYRAAGQTYLAYSGPYRVDAAKGTVTHSIKVSLFPNWAANTQTRLMDFPDGKLRLRFAQPQRSNGALKSATLIWERAAGAVE